MKGPVILKKGADSLGVALSGEASLKLLELADHVLFWRGVAGLTSYTDMRDILIYMVLDSLAAVPLLASPAPQRVLDLGTGAGFPGLPLRIALPSLDITLMDSSTKKAEFLGRLTKALDLDDVKVLCCRADEAEAKGLSCLFDVVVSRACTSLGELAQLSSPYLRPGGRLLAWKGPQLNREIEEAGSTLSDCSLRLEDPFPYTLPFAGRSCTVASVRKI